MRFNQSIARFMCFTVSTFLLASPFLIGCEGLPQTATVTVEVSSPKVLEPADALRLIVSTDYQGVLSNVTPSTKLKEVPEILSTNAKEIASNGFIYNTKKEFSITQDFNRTFQLDPDEPRIAVELIKPGPSGSVRLTVLLDDEVEYEQSLTGTGFLIWNRDFRKKEISF